MKKVSIFLAAVLVALSVFTACNNTDPNEKDTGTQNNTTTSENKDSDTSNDTSSESKPETSDSKAETTDEPETDPVQNIDPLEKAEYEIPKAATAPVIDGTCSEDEWKDALTRTLTNENTVEVAGGKIVCQGATFRYLWDENGLYVCAEINDATLSSKHVAGNGSYNSKDGAQIAIYIDKTCTAGAVGKLFFFSLCPEADDGKAYIGEHFIYGNGSTGKDVPDAAIASSKTETGYIIECRIDAAAFAKADPAIKLEAGTELALVNVILDHNGSTQALFVDTAWFNAPNTSVYYLAD